MDEHIFAPLASMQPNACFTKAYYKCVIYRGVSAITSERERERHGQRDRETKKRQTDRETDGQTKRTLVPEIT